MTYATLFPWAREIKCCEFTEMRAGSSVVSTSRFFGRGKKSEVSRTSIPPDARRL